MPRVESACPAKATTSAEFGSIGGSIGVELFADPAHARRPTGQEERNVGAELEGPRGKVGRGRRRPSQAR